MQTTKYRSKMMSKIRSTGGKAETILGKAIWHKGIRYFRNYKKLPGKPDVQYPLGLTLEIIKVSVLGGILYCKLFNY